MNLDLYQLAHQAFFGGVAAAGFGVLFNIGLRSLPWYAASGALALGVRTFAQSAGWSFEIASFTAAAAVGCSMVFLPERVSRVRNALAVAGCIPMVPGSAAAKAILGFFALTTQPAADSTALLLVSFENLLRVMFTIGAIATGLAIPTLLRPRAKT
jgi:uncharacterized membrane protein YjjB (DUF3815 family)